MYLSYSGYICGGKGANDFCFTQRSKGAKFKTPYLFCVFCCSRNFFAPLRASRIYIFFIFFMRKVLALLLTVFVFASSSAQIVQFGITGDIAFDQWRSGSGEPFQASTVDPDLGWSAGVKLKVSSPIGLGFDIAAKYAQEDRNYYMTSVGYTSEGKFSYLSVPVNLRYDIKFPVMSRVLIPFAFAGPDFHYNLDNFKWRGLTDEGVGDVTDYVEDYVKENKLGWNLNFGVGVILGRHVEIAYTHTIRQTDPIELTLDKEMFGELESRYKNRTNKIAMTIYF